ncbi:hypothetical protein C2G38_2083588 [Gigaspora rosea]|uniref:Ubiquitin 3 binding protein But2 C-terminal domain-containing protein n=1 Tax=Gigaspora rosea TaxID=44941 RepID=A0A397V9X4_9GLOM|nr:hypothetical protein C2G38_2083588 [Gigaspora rosea]
MNFKFLLALILVLTVLPQFPDAVKSVASDKKLDPDAPLSEQAPTVIGGNNVFVINVPPIIVNAEKTADTTGCKHFKLKFHDVLDLKGKACLTSPPTIKFCTSSPFGYHFGCVKGDLSKGVTLNIHSSLVKGYLKLFLKDEDTCVWATVDISPDFRPTYSDTVNLFCI